MTVRTSRARRMRYRRAGRGHARGRLRRLNEWLASRAADASAGGIGDTGAAAVAVTVDNTTDLIAEAAHGFSAGAGPMLFPSGTPPGGLSVSTPYFLAASTAGDYFVAGSRREALEGRHLPISSDGATVTRAPGANSRSFFELLKAGKSPLVIQEATDIDTLIFT